MNCGTSGDEVDVQVFLLGTWLKCFKIPAQTPTGGGVTYTNSGAYVQVSAEITGIEYTKEGACGSGTGNNATYSGSATIAGTNTEGGGVGVWFQ